VGEGEAVALGGQVPGGLLQRRFGQGMAAHEAEARTQLFGLFDVRAEEGGDEEVLEDVPGGSGRLVAVAGVVGGYALAPARPGPRRVR
jgi:hypothetical protein